jgi:two-component sensor histidine kinase
MVLSCHQAGLGVVVSQALDSRIVKGLLHAILISLLAARLAPAGTVHAWPERWLPRLNEIEKRLAEIETELKTLPAMSDIDARGTHGFHSNFSLESEEHWFEMSWPQAMSIDGIAMIPTRITTQSGLRSNYGLPVRMRIEATRKGQKQRFVLAEVADTRLRLRRGEPLYLDIKAEDITSIRVIPIDLPTLPGKNVRFFSLAEILVYQGDVNIARGAKFRASYSIDGEVGWNIHYLTDEQSPLGPPELPQPGKSLGWHGDLSRGAETPSWAIIDLGSSRSFDAIRLVAARGDAPLKGPGFGFPEQFTFETSDDPALGWKEIWNSGKKSIPNPGYNTRTFRFPPAKGRYVRISISKPHTPDGFTIPRMLISEFEVLDGIQNLALHQPVSTPDSYESIPHDSLRVWSRAGLTDGHSSTGLLIPEKQWVASLSRRFDLICERSQLTAESGKLITYWRNASIVVVFVLLAATVVGLLFRQVRMRLENRRAVTALRRRISSDLHDEVGSNLATIALLSELTPSPANLDDINRLSRESSMSLREIVDITLASKRARKPLLDRLREIASLMLRHHEWSFEGNDSPSLDLEERKNLVFFFKETLHNIIRHAGAKKVRIVVEKAPPDFRVLIEDDGKGMENSSPEMLGNLNTLQQRAKSLGGSLDVDSKPGKGTRITLVFPIHSRK